MNDLPEIDGDALWRIAGRAMAAALSRAPGLVVREAPGAWRATSDVNTWMANWLACFGPDEASRAMLEAGLDDAARTGRSTSVVIGEAARDTVMSLLAQNRLVSEGADAMMWRDARSLPENPRTYPGRVTEVEAGTDLMPVVDLIARTFRVYRHGSRQAFAGALDDPAMKMFTASSDGLDSVCMTWSEGHHTYIYLVATAPERQRRGAGWAVMAEAMTVAMRDGATTFFLEASEEGEGLYRKMGYETFELAGFWVANPTPDE